MKSTTARRAAALILAAPLALTACSGSNSTTPSGTTSASSTAATLGDLTPGGQVDPAKFFAVTKAAADANKTYSFTTQIGEAGADMSSTGVVDNSDANNRKRQITLKDDQGESQLVIAGGQVFMKNANLLGGKWVQTPVNPALESMLGGTSGRIEQDQQLVKSITYVGEEDVAGTKTRHFTLTVDPTKATTTATTTATTATSAAPTPAATAATTSSIGSAVTVEYWLDDANRTRKMKHTVAGVPSVTTYEKWGEPVTITVPSADQVTTTGAPTAPGSPAPSASAGTN